MGETNSVFDSFCIQTMLNQTFDVLLEACPKSLSHRWKVLASQRVRPTIPQVWRPYAYVYKTLSLQTCPHREKKQKEKTPQCANCGAWCCATRLYGCKTNAHLKTLGFNILNLAKKTNIITPWLERDTYPSKYLTTKTIPKASVLMVE